MSVKIFGPILKSSCFLTVEFHTQFLVYFEEQSFIICICSKYFLPVYGFSSQSLKNVFQSRNFFISMKSNLTIISFMYHISGALYKLLLNPKSSSFFPPLSSRSLIILSFIFRSINHFVLIFVKVVWSMSSSIFFFFMFFSRSFSIIFWKDHFSLFCPFSSFKNQLTIFVWVYLSTLWSIQLIYLSVLLPLSHCLYHSSIVCPSTLSFFNIVLTTLDLLPLSINVRINLLIFKKLAGVFIEIVLNL